MTCKCKLQNFLLAVAGALGRTLKDASSKPVRDQTLLEAVVGAGPGPGRGAGAELGPGLWLRLILRGW